MRKNNLLFSIGVLTYNSEATILETLNSIRDIDYPNIELIISDDCSKDATLDKCEKWLSENDKRFTRTCLLTMGHNTFTSANCNRALNECEGDWVCLVAGDDVLYRDSILRIIDYINDNPSAQWIVGKYNKFHDSCVPENFIKEGAEFNSDWKNKFLLDSHEQYKWILSSNFICLPTAFCQRQVLLNVGGYDEKYGILEDYPMNIKLLKNNVKCHLLDDYIMGYRMGVSNVSNSSSKLFNIYHRRSHYQVLEDFCFEYYSPMKIRNAKNKILMSELFYRLGMDKNNVLNRKLLTLISRLNDLIFKGQIINI